MSEGPWLSPLSASEYALCSVKTILAALRDGTLRGYQRKPGGTWRIHQDDLDAWIRGQDAPVPAPIDGRARKT